MSALASAWAAYSAGDLAAAEGVLREALAQGCPLDLHPRAFKVGQSAGSVFFKASVWLWQTGDEPTFEVLVRRSFQNYAWEMLQRVSRESGLCEWVQA